MKKNDNDKTTRVSQRKRVVWFFYEQQIFESLSLHHEWVYLSLSLSTSNAQRRESGGRESDWNAIMKAAQGK
jgi:hypothetical protein